MGSKSRSMGAPSRVRLACALGAVSFSNVGEVGVGKATNGESGNRPQRAQVHLLPVSCVIAASHRALNATNRDEKPAFQSDGLAAFGMSFGPQNFPTQRSPPISLDIGSFGRTATPSMSG